MTSCITIDRVHQILITDSGRLPVAIPHALSFNIDSIYENYRNAPYKLWSGDDVAAFIASEFGQETLDAYLALRPFSYRSDLARFCLLYALGGLYVDLGVRILRPWQIPSGKGIGAFRDISFISDSWTALQTGLLWSRPGRPEMKIAIETIIRHVREQYYGANPLYPTGPVMLGRAFIRAMAAKGCSEEADDQQIGDCRALTSDADVINLCYVTRQGSFVAMRTKDRDGDLAQFGLEGINNYNAIWRCRAVYGETVRRWTYKDPLVRRHWDVEEAGGALVIAPGPSGIAVFGPYVDLPIGAYEVELLMASESDVALVSVEITSDCGASVLSKREIELHQSDASSRKQNLTLWREASMVEIRIANRSSSKIAIRAYTITKLSCSRWRFDSAELQYRDIIRGTAAAEIRSDRHEALVYGPYVNVPAGSYDLHAIFHRQSKINEPRLEVTSDAGSSIIEASNWNRYSADEKDRLSLRFTLDHDVRNVEFRLSCSIGSMGGFLGYELCRLDNNSGSKTGELYQ